MTNQRVHSFKFGYSWVSCNNINNIVDSTNSNRHDNFLCARLGIMIYPTDFIRYPNKFGKNVRNIKISTIGLEISERKSKRKMQSEKVNHSIVAATDESILIRYLNNSTVHGFRYLTDPTIRRTER